MSHTSVLGVGTRNVEQRKLSLTTYPILWRWGECLDPRLGNFPFSPFQFPPSLNATQRRDQSDVSGSGSRALDGSFQTSRYSTVLNVKEPKGTRYSE